MIQDLDPTPFGVTPVPDGGVTTARGFKAAGIHAGFRDDPNRLDMALIESDELVNAAGVFTTNEFCAAPVIVSREHLAHQGFSTARAIIVNSGIANAATGDAGLTNARESARTVAEAIGAAREDVLVASTGVIGQQLDMEPFSRVSQAHEQASREGGHDAARAMMTTDTHPKECAVRYISRCTEYEGHEFTVGGMVKGSGMIMPNMATMIAVLTTDAPVVGDALHEALTHAVNASFNKVTVDSDTSTNDSCFLLASGAQAPDCPAIARESEAFAEFERAVRYVCIALARRIAADGEGATKLVTVRVSGAVDDAQADMAARTVANSPLVKTAIYGHDCNWGRIAAALGRSGAQFSQRDVDIDVMGIPVCRSGLNVPFDEDEALRRFEEQEITISCSLNAGSAETTVWTCDFSHEYVTINGDYRS